MINILFYAEELNVGGVEKMILQWVENKPDEINIDLCVRKVCSQEYYEKMVSFGSSVYEIGCGVKDIPIKAKYIKRILSQKDYDIVHVHTSMATDFFVLAVAKHMGVKHRIAHSHNVPIFPKIITRWADKLCKPLLRHYATNFFGCSKQAIIALFGNKPRYIEKCTVIKNGIDVEQFKFSVQHREDLRKKFNIAHDEFVIGSVGRLDFQKNYSYLLKVVTKLTIDKEKVKILIIGEGEERKELQKFADDNNICLLLPGKRNDVNKILSCFDVFVLTSRYEGFPVVMMEAQANGLCCIVSEAIPQEALLDEQSNIIELKNSTEWSEIMNSYIKKYKHDDNVRSEKGAVVKMKGYDILDCSREMVYIYATILGQRNQ